jgi:hypothetical protein
MNRFALFFLNRQHATILVTLAHFTLLQYRNNCKYIIAKRLYLTKRLKNLIRGQR